jgi:Actin like proteins N terminal domain
VALDVGFGYTKIVSDTGADVFPSVVGEWDAGRPSPGWRLNGKLHVMGVPGDSIEAFLLFSGRRLIEGVNTGTAIDSGARSRFPC